MNSSIDNRKKAFENNFALKGEQEFKAKVMATRSLGLWAATEMKLKDSIANSYSKSLIDISILHKDYIAVIDHIYEDFSQHHINVPKSKLESMFLERFDQFKNNLEK